MTKIKGFVVVTDNKSKCKPVPVGQKFLMVKSCAVCLRDEMNVKRSVAPETYIYSYKILKATLTLED